MTLYRDTPFLPEEMVHVKFKSRYFLERLIKRPLNKESILSYLLLILMLQIEDVTLLTVNTPILIRLIRLAGYDWPELSRVEAATPSSPAEKGWTDPAVFDYLSRLLRNYHG